MKETPDHSNLITSDISGHGLSSVKRRKPIIALLLSLLTLGLGQIYNGQFWKGIALFLAGLIINKVFNIFHFASTFRGAAIEFLIGLIFSVYVIMDALRTAKRIGHMELHNYQRWYVYVGFFLISLITMMPYFQTYKTYKMSSGSMQPSMHIEECFVVDLKAYLENSPKRGDLVIFEYPEDKKIDFTKRVVGLPGEKIEIRNKQVFINNNLLEESYIQHVDDSIISGSVNPRDNFGPLIIPPQCFFVMGDNRDQSHDSRFYNCVDAKLIKAKVLYIYWSPKFNRIGLQIK